MVGAQERAVTRDVSLAWTGFALALPVFVLFTFTLPAFARPAMIDAAAIPNNGARIEANFENGMQLRGYQLGARAVTCRDALDVHLYWTNDQRIRETYRVFAHLVNAQGAVAGNKDVIPDDFEFGMLPDDWDQFQILMDNALIRVPSLEKTGIKTFMNGPESFTPDDRYYLGEAPGLSGFFVAAGFNSIGIQSAGGAGRSRFSTSAMSW